MEPEGLPSSSDKPALNLIIAQYIYITFSQPIGLRSIFFSMPRFTKRFPSTKFQPK
jgi:hypothetical protein